MDHDWIEINSVDNSLPELIQLFELIALCQENKIIYKCANCKYYLVHNKNERTYNLDNTNLEVQWTTNIDLFNDRNRASNMKFASSKDEFPNCNELLMKEVL